VSRSSLLAHIVHEDDVSVSGVWGVHRLRSAFQPIFRFDGGRLRLAAFEGLLRASRDGAPVAPPVFFRSVPPGERLQVENLTRTLHLINAGAFLDASSMVFVNFDPSIHLEREIAAAVLDDMRHVMGEAGIDPRRVVCEVTEQPAGSQQGLAMFVDALRDHGLRIAVDDYGSEDSDMERVSALRPDIVKFDARWITRLMDTRPGSALLSVMVDQFCARGVETVFEGIEETWQLELAETCGATMVQGFALARPEIVPADFTMFSFSAREPGAPSRDTGSARDGDKPATHHRPPFGRRGST
jgi:EAL domain-containing protein (putative c-di-GMP-specific phosphodiesterase class I)